MTLHGLLLFCLVYALAVASPGPGIAALLARVLSRGREGVAAFIVGYVVGDLIWFTLAATGMAALAQSAHLVFLIVKYAGVAYLLYLAWRLWTQPAQPIVVSGEQPRRRSSQLFLGSLALTMGNPKPMIFFMALLPTVIDLAQLSLADFVEIALAICIILSAVASLYAVAAMRARRLFKSVTAVRWLNRGTGTVMAGAAITVATR